MNNIINGDALEELRKLPSESVDCIVTSPPYFHLRDYEVEGQIGLEKTVEEYIEKLVAVFREARRVLKPAGTLWVNIADSYNGSGKGFGDKPEKRAKFKQNTNRGWQNGRNEPTRVENIKNKDLIGVPFLLALALRADGWYFRQDIIWEKTNCMPESVRDRCTKAHEYLFLFSKSPRYYFDFEAIREPCVGFDNSPVAGSKGSTRPNSRRRKGNRKVFRGGGAYTNGKSFQNGDGGELTPSNSEAGNAPNDSGLRRRRSVWHIASVGSRDEHFATFPPKLAGVCIIAGCPRGGTVLDPFAGSGTVGVVAECTGRYYTLIELKPEYAELCRRRLKSSVKPITMTGEEVDIPPDHPLAGVVRDVGTYKQATEEDIARYEAQILGIFPSSAQK